MLIKEFFSKFKDNSRTNCTFLEFQEFSRTKVIFKDFSRSVPWGPLNDNYCASPGSTVLGQFNATQRLPKTLLV